MDKAPKPIKIIFFLLMLVGLVSMIPFFLHLFGFHCNTSSELVQTSPLKVITNLKLGFIGADEYINTSSYVPENLETLGLATTSCRKPVCISNGNYYYQSNTQCDNKTIVYPYLTNRLSYSRCITCSGEINHTAIFGVAGFVDNVYLCHGDANRIDKDDMNWFQSWSCDEDRCIPPNHYYYEYDTGTYDCLDNDICGLNASEIISLVDDLLENADGELLYKTSETKDYKSVVRLNCDKQLSPQLTFFGIPVFDYRIWLMLIIIYIMFMFLSHIKKH